MSKSVILCVDDERAVLDILSQQLLESLGREYEIELAESGSEALEVLEQIREDGQQLAVVVSDQIMPGMKGDELLIQVHERFPDTRTILLTGQASLEAVQNAINHASLYRYITKPWESRDMVLTVGEAARSYTQLRQIEEFGQRNRLLQQLNRSTQEISSEINLQLLVRRFLESTQEITRIERLFLLTEHGERLHLLGLISNDPLENERLQELFQTDYDALVQDVKRLLEVIRAQSYSRAYSTFFPLQKGTRRFGFVVAENSYSQQALDSDQLEILKMLVSQVSISIENANLYSSLDAQKKVIEDKNRNILDSIKYARRIQYALLPGEETLQKTFPHAFVFYYPKEIVSGDFYWYYRTDDNFFLATVDCTGHGVPGAFMSVLGSSQLNEIVIKNHVHDPAEVLSALNLKIAENLSQGLGDEIHDGMDISLCRIDLESRKIHFAGANLPAWLYRNGRIHEVRPDKQPIGHSALYGKERTFNTHVLETQPRDVLYLFSDGIIDQFGGEDGRRLNKKRFMQMLESLNQHPLREQGQWLTDFITQWQGANEQTDDMMVIGVGF